MPRDRKTNKAKRGRYSVGGKKGRSRWLLSIKGGKRTDDRHLNLARRFAILAEAEEIALEHMAVVFEIVDEKTCPATLKEVF